MNSFLLALQFLTITPIKVRACEDKNLSRSPAFFPLVGLLIGVALWLALELSVALGLGDIAYAILPIVLLAALTGGLHLDGLSDTADALLSGKSKEEMLTIMRDPRAGALGTATLICCLLLKIAFLAGIPLEARGKALMLACAAGRWPLVFSLYGFPYARKAGKATPFIDGINGKILLTAGTIACAVSLLAAGFKGLLVLTAITLFVLLLDRLFTRKLGGITGDTLGASVELSEVFALFLLTLVF